MGIVGGGGLGQEGMWVVFTGNGWLPPSTCREVHYQSLWEAICVIIMLPGACGSQQMYM